MGLGVMGLGVLGLGVLGLGVQVEEMIRVPTIVKNVGVFGGLVLAET